MGHLLQVLGLHAVSKQLFYRAVNAIFKKNSDQIGTDKVVNAEEIKQAYSK